MKMIFAAVVCCWGLLGLASELHLEHNFLLLSHKKKSKLIQDLDVAARAGYRVKCGTLNQDGNFNLFLVKDENGMRCEYRMISNKRFKKIKSDLHRLAAEGYRMIPTTLMTRSKPLKDPSFQLIMERVSGGARFEYMLLISKMNENLISVLGKAHALGFQVVAMFINKEKVQAIFLEKPAS